ncbi:MAG: hypothetical protein WD598_02705 [Acidimicrobiia bacterium]
MRQRGTTTSVVALATIAVVLGWVAPVGAVGGVGGCALATKKEVSKILGAKVTKTKNKVDKDSGAQTCTYKTNEFDSEVLEASGAPLQVVITWGPIPDSLRGQYEGSEILEGLGDVAYDLGFGQVVAFSGEQSVDVTVENSESPEGKLSKKAQKAIRLALPRLPVD